MNYLLLAALGLTTILSAAESKPEAPPPTTITLIIKTTAGQLVADAKVHIRQYTRGDDQPPAAPIDEVLTSDRDGRVVITTTAKRNVVAEFRVPGYRPVRFEIDRPYPTYPEGQIDFTWATHPGSQRMDTGEIFSQLPRDAPLLVTILLPGPNDDDNVYEAAVRALWPKEKKP